jgi:asparagine synthase (glutamine-hydrolysing)
VNLDGAPVAREPLQDMTAFLAFRGPDAQDIWSDGPVGLGHTMLRTTLEAEHEHQPLSLDGAVWITADARIDARGELQQKLAAKGRTGLSQANDAELILHAYSAWGEGFLAHLIGDFAFAIWDEPRKRLVCARDHFGVKPFFYARVGAGIVFSNTLNCIRRHPAVRDTLDDLSIADFLLFEMNQDPAASAFADIRRLPPGSCLIASRQGLQVREYWTLPLETKVRYRAAGDYVEHFKELLGVAVADRLRTDRIGVELTGGLDSTSVAATALSLLSRQSRPFELNALTVVYDRLIPDEERRYAAMVAAKLGIPIHFFAADDYGLYERCELAENHLPEPANEPGTAAAFDTFRRAASLGRVMLTGQDGDALFNESPKPYFRALLKDRQLARLLSGIVSYGVSQRRIVPLTLRAWMNSRRANGAEAAAYPAWISPDLEARLDLRSRWQQALAEPAMNHPIRPYAFRVLAYIRRLSNYFEYCDPGLTRVPVEYRHPLMDLRLHEYCLSLPPLPWCVKKRIVREAMRGVLPEPVRRRAKTPLAGSPEMELLRQPGTQWIDQFVPAPGLSLYVDRGKIPSVRDDTDRDERWSNLRPLGLSFWLQGLQRTP